VSCSDQDAVWDAETGGSMGTFITWDVEAPIGRGTFGMLG